MERIIVETVVPSDIKTVWEHWNNPESIKGWAFASDDWEAPNATNDLRPGGKFVTTMAAKDGSESFDFSGTYTEIVEPILIKYEMDQSDTDAQNRDCTIAFKDNGDSTTTITETFYPETENSIEMQKAGWQAILENFKKFVEGRSNK